MAAPSEEPVCRLCLRQATLCDSHFMPAVFYRHLNLDETGTFQNRALRQLTKDKLAHVPKQVTKYLLCIDCERRFSRGGERWTSQVGYQVGRSFHLQRTLKALPTPQTVKTGLVYYAADSAEIEWEKLAYFALSVFWRGAADPWTARNGDRPFIAMEPALMEQLRRFLLGEDGYPPDILLMLRVASGRSNATHMMSFPSKGDMELPEGPAAQYSFFVPGMIFTLAPGIPPKYIEQGCLIRGIGHPILMMGTDDLFIREIMTLAVTATPSQKVIDEMKAKLSVAKEPRKRAGAK